MREHRGKCEEKNFLKHKGEACYFFNTLYKIKSMKRKERKRRSWHGFTGREESEGNYEMVQVKISGLEVTAVMIRVTELCTHA